MLIGILFISCDKNDDEPSDCGCNSETNYTITETDSLIGKIYYRSQNSTYNNLYSIIYKEVQYSNSSTFMIVCNEDFLNNEFEDIKNSGESVEVKFSGDLKSICEKPNGPADISYYRIILTSIERL
ncbi:hypothetical protein GCM10010976_04740 [Bizionia arctica]|uniref:Uncharacterized protein n=2 Tax=Bizionia arctica TaxID=1495645 RepID=A0A917LKI6_9FLAO|nr:hypothetical protein GCM10010976_04740 [Bizionia arctica]